MKTTDDPNEHIEMFHKKLKENFTDIEITSFLMTLLGASEVSNRFIWETVKDFMDIPSSVKYAMVQHANFFVMFHHLLHNRLEKHGKVKYMPVDPDATWKSEEEYEKRLIHVIKMFHKQLKKEGKL